MLRGPDEAQLVTRSGKSLARCLGSWHAQLTSSKSCMPAHPSAPDALGTEAGFPSDTLGPLLTRLDEAVSSTCSSRYISF